MSKRPTKGFGTVIFHRKGVRHVYALTKFAQHKTLLTIVAALVFAFFLAPLAMNAQVFDPNDPLGVNPVKGDAVNPGIALGGQDIRTTIGKVINVALSLLGVIAVVIILIGGFKWMTAGGTEDKTAEARKLIFAGIIGLAIILSAWAIAKFVINALGTATGVEGFQQIQ